MPRRNLSPAALYEQAILRQEAHVVSTGALTAETGKHTGRSPKDKFFVKESTSQDAIWWHPGNQAIGSQSFDGLLHRMQEFIDTHDVFTQDVFACADPRYRLRVRVITEFAWHSLFARNLFIRPTADELMEFEPDFTVISLPSVKADPARDGTHSETFVLVNLGRRIVLIGGTGYAGEIKKSIFTALNYLLPAQNVFPMHCSANTSVDGSDVALFFGLDVVARLLLVAQLALAAVEVLALAVEVLFLLKQSLFDLLRLRAVLTGFLFGGGADLDGLLFGLEQLLLGLRLRFQECLLRLGLEHVASVGLAPAEEDVSNPDADDDGHRCHRHEQDENEIERHVTSTSLFDCQSA